LKLIEVDVRLHDGHDRIDDFGRVEHCMRNAIGPRLIVTQRSLQQAKGINARHLRKNYPARAHMVHERLEAVQHCFVALTVRSNSLNPFEHATYEQVSDLLAATAVRFLTVAEVLLPYRIADLLVHRQTFYHRRGIPRHVEHARRQKAQDWNHDPASVDGKRIGKLGDKMQSNERGLRLHFDIELERRLELAQLLHAGKEHLQQAGEAVLARHDSSATLSAEDLSSAWQQCLIFVAQGDANACSLPDSPHVCDVLSSKGARLSTRVHKQSQAGERNF